MATNKKTVREALMAASLCLRHNPDAETRQKVACQCDAAIALLDAAGNAPLSPSEMGRRGGASTSEAKAAAVRANGAKGGRPRKPTIAARVEPEGIPLDESDTEGIDIDPATVPRPFR